MRNKKGNKMTMSPTAAKPSPSFMPYKIETTQANSGAMTTIKVIPQIMNVVFFDLPRHIMKTIDTINTKAITTTPIANFNPPNL